MRGADANKGWRSLGRRKADPPHGKRRGRKDERGGGDKFIAARRGKRQDAGLPEMVMGPVPVFGGVDRDENLDKRKYCDSDDERCAFIRPPTC